MHHPCGGKTKGDPKWKQCLEDQQKKINNKFGVCTKGEKSLQCIPKWDLVQLWDPGLHLVR